MREDSVEFFFMQQIHPGGDLADKFTDYTQYNPVCLDEPWCSVWTICVQIRLWELVHGLMKLITCTCSCQQLDSDPALCKYQRSMD